MRDFTIKVNKCFKIFILIILIVYVELGARIRKTKVERGLSHSVVA